MRGHNQRPVGSFATVLALAAIVGCQVQLVERHDPRISQGLSDYQLALEDFTLKVLDSYAQCDLYRGQLAEIRKVDCSIEPVATRNACQARKDKDAADAGAKAEQACTAASYPANAESFYFPNEALLRVLVVRARVLDSGGACIGALGSVKRLAASVTDERLRQSVSTMGAFETRNCTEVQMQQILNNHNVLKTQHQTIDRFDAEDQSGPQQASMLIQVARDTLEQNIQIALFLEEAKKRGAE